jgi:hypothetical protein
MSRGTDIESLTNTAAIATGSNYVLGPYGSGEHDYVSLCVTHTATTALAIKLVAVNAGVSAAITLTTAFIGNTASQVATGTAEFYKIEGGFFESLKIKLSATATVASGAVSIGLFMGRND